jgi:peptidoglycan/xylan/chitin deacetylase (PgdA/CDA1 family)
MSALRKVASRLRKAGLDRPLDALIGSLCEVKTDRPVFHLTFDDGPHPEVTPRVLDVLDEEQAKATFYVLADAAARHPELVREVLDRGHEVGLHGRTHVRLSTASWSVVRDEIIAAHREVEEIARRPVKLFRPPYGAHGLRSLYACRSLGLMTVLWSVDTDDWKGLTPEEPLQGTTHKIAAGGISLAHDTPVGESVAEDAANGLVAKEELTRVLLRAVRERGLEPVSFAELIAQGTPVNRAKVNR